MSLDSSSSITPETTPEKGFTEPLPITKTGHLVVKPEGMYVIVYFPLSFVTTFQYYFQWKRCVIGIYDLLIIIELFFIQ